MKSNQMVSFDNIISTCFKAKDVYIPLIQRNYKWDSGTAAKLATDLWRAFLNKQKTYTVGMITLYGESDGRMQLIDGQQRVITLYMLLKYLKPDEEYFSFRFERDEGITENEYTRQNYLKKIHSTELSEKYMYTDLIRFKNNYNEMVKELTTWKENNEDLSYNYIAYTPKYADNFINYIRENVYFLLHISDTEPFDEFINLNKNKTRFVISDRIKANLIIDSEEKKKRDEVITLFKDLSEMLFLERDIWELVKQGYNEENMPDGGKREKCKHYPDENRLKLLCCERYGSDNYDVSSTLGYQYEDELELLKHYCEILTILLSDIDIDNWNSYNAFNCLYKLDKIVNDDQGEKNTLRFFRMLKNNGFRYLEDYLLKECIEMEEPFSQACFIESQLEYGKIKLNDIDTMKKIRKEFNEEEQENWLYNGTSEFETFCQIYSDYIKNKYMIKEVFP